MLAALLQLCCCSVSWHGIADLRHRRSISSCDKCFTWDNVCAENEDGSLIRARHFYSLKGLDENDVPFRVESEAIVEDLASFSALEFTEPPIENGKYVQAHTDAES